MGCSTSSSNTRDNPVKTFVQAPKQGKNIPVVTVTVPEAEQERPPMKTNVTLTHSIVNEKAKRPSSAMYQETPVKIIEGKDFVYVPKLHMEKNFLYNKRLGKLSNSFH